MSITTIYAVTVTEGAPAELRTLFASEDPEVFDRLKAVVSPVLEKFVEQEQHRADAVISAELHQRYMKPSGNIGRNRKVIILSVPPPENSYFPSVFVGTEYESAAALSKVFNCKYNVVSQLLSKSKGTTDGDGKENFTATYKCVAFAYLDDYKEHQNDGVVAGI